ncbi:beta strand repeat-containing protein [Phascolarctobacterium succinatutens]
MDDITVTKKVLNVTGNTVNRTYGDLLKNHDYALSINGFDGFNDAMKAELDGKVTIIDSQDTIQNSNDTGIITVGDEKRTKNKGTYEWQAGVKLDGSLTGNYEFQNDGVSSTTTTVHGVSNVLARKIYLNDINANLTYGSKDAINNHINGVVSIKDLANAIVYGDDVKLADGAVVNVKDGSSYATNKGGRNTADADTYADSLKIDNAMLTGDANKLGNYELVNNATGSITVDQATMHVKLNDVERTYGNTALINSTSYGVNGLTGNVNGDNYGAGDVNMGTGNRDGAVDGVSGSKVTNDAGNYKWNANVVAANDKLKQNYKLVVDDGASVVKQATLQVSLNDVVRTYGNATITSGGYSAGNITGLVNGDSYNAGDVKVTVTGDGATDGVSDNRVTNDAGNYEWTGSVSTTNAGLGKNYNLVVTANGKSKVEKATLNVGLSDVVRTYGNAAITSGGYSAGNITGLVNGDNYDASDFKVTVNSDGAIAGVTGDRVTNDHGDYTWSGTVEVANAGLNKNYDLVVNGNGNSYVGKAQLSVSLNDVVRTYGNATITSGGYSAGNITGLVNGDSYNAGDVKVTVTGDGATDGVSGSKVTNDAGNYEWTGSASTTNAGLGKNYNLVVTANGKSTVEKATLNVGLSDVVRTYGNTSFTEGTGYGIKDHDALVNGDKGTVSLNKDAITDGGLVDNNSKTNNKGDYKWNVGENGIVADGVTNFAKNYDIQVTAGNSKVNAKKIYLNNINASTTYGSKDGLQVDGNVSLQDNSIVYGDKVSLKDGASVSYKADGEYAANKGDRDTADAGTYKADVAVTGAELVGNELGNYELVNNATGVITVKKATLNVGLNDVVRTYGDTSFTDGTGYGIKDYDALVNGDEGTLSIKEGAITDGGLVDNNSKTNNKGDYKWNVGENGIVADGVTNFAKNYDIQVTAGNSKVNAKKIYLNNINASTTYGSKDGLQVDGNVSLQDNSIVYGDKVSLKDGASVSYKADGEYAANKGDRDTADAGTYKADVAVTGAELVGNELGNYELVNNATGVITVKKATLNVGLNDVVRTYGNAKITSGSYSAGNITGLVNGDSYKAGDVKVTVTGDGALTGNPEGKVTNNAGDYTWSGTATTDNAGLGKNYNLVVKGNGKSTVEKASLVVNLNDITRVYGNLDAKDYSKAFTFGANAGLVNGDNGLVINADKDGAIAEGSVSDVKKTNNVGSYEWNGTASGVDNLNTNYDVTVNAGKSDVTKAKLVVNLNDITRVYGNLDAKDYSKAFTFGANAGLVNGDSGLVINADKDGAIAGGTLTNVEKTNNVGSYEWNGTASGVDNLNTNYDVTVNAGKSDVTKAKLVVNLNDITRVYGNLDAKNYSNAYTFGENAGLVNGDNGLVIDANADGAIAEGSVGDVKKTNNVGKYEWNGTASGVDNLNTNYDVTVNAGKSDVTKAKLVVNLNDITRVYGNLDAKDYSKAFTFGANAGLVNGDNGLVINADKDGAIAGGTLTNVEKTNNVGSYEWNGTVSGVDNLNTNYAVTVNAGKSDVTKANLVVNLNDITRVYGNLDAKNYSNAFTFGANAGLVNGDNGLVINADKDGAIAGGTLTNVEKTNNVGSYEWNGTVSGVDNLNTNYAVTVNAGKSDVTKANLVVNLNDITRVYGNLDAKDYSKAFTFGANAGLVNGDNGLVINADKDGAIAGGTLTNVEKTNNVGSYEWNGTASGVDNLNTNYNVQINAGKSEVTKAKLTFVVDDKTITQGVPAKYTGKANGLTNGDTLAGIGVGGYELDSSVNPLIVGVYEDKIGVLINGSLHLTGGDGLLKNYKVEIDPGTLTVLASFNPADDYWFGTAPWDKERNLRERKAEFHYVAGGMSL